MNPIRHASNNAVMRAPEGHEDDCIDMHVTQTSIGDIPFVVSFWQPTPEEIKQVLMGRPVRIWIAGKQQPMMAVDIDEPNVIQTRKPDLKVVK